MTIKVRTQSGDDVEVFFQRCGGLNDCLRLDYPSGKVATVHRRGRNWIEAAVAGVVCRYCTHPTQQDALREAALDYVYETAGVVV